jgi:hypothetical protein
MLSRPADKNHDGWQPRAHNGTRPGHFPCGGLREPRFSGSASALPRANSLRWDARELESGSTPCRDAVAVPLARAADPNPADKSTTTPRRGDG